MYENYLELSVKHGEDCHVDYFFDGIYTCNSGIISKFIIRGPVADIHTILKQSIDNDIYIVLNINEQFLPHRQAYQKEYFRHDILIVGYDDEAETYITVGIDENMHYRKVMYSFLNIEKAYYSMQSEWDYEIFLFRFNKEYCYKMNKEKIKLQLENYCKAKNPNIRYLEEFLKNQNNTIEFVSNNYVGDFYGIRVYDYLINKIRKQYKLFGTIQEADKLGVLELRSLNVLMTHDKIIKNMLDDILKIPHLELQKDFERIETIIAGVRILILKYFSDGQKKSCKKAVELLKRAKEMELYTIMKVIDLL